MYSSHCQLFRYTNLRLTNKYAQQNDIQLLIFQGSPRKDFHYIMGFKVCQQKVGINFCIFTKISFFLATDIFFDYGGAKNAPHFLYKEHLNLIPQRNDSILG